MAYRCRKCGYRFRASDTDLCPECFTAREDTPGFGRNGFDRPMSDAPSGGDFIAEQLREESRMSGDELRERISGFTDGIKRSISGVIPPNTYQQAPPPQGMRAPYQPNRGQQYGAPTIIRAPYQQNGGQQYAAPKIAPSYCDPYAMARQEFEIDRPEKKTNVVGNIVALALFINFFVIIMILLFSDISYRIKNSGKNTEVKNTSSEKIERFYCEGSNAEAYQYGCDGLDGDWSDTLNIRYGSGYDKTLWYTLNCDITLPEGSSAERVFFTGYDAAGNVNYTWITDAPQYADGSRLEGVRISVSKSASYKLVVELTDKNGENRRVSFKPDMDNVISDLFPSTLNDTINV